MKKTTLDLIALRKLANYNSRIDSNALTLLIHRLKDKFYITFASDRCQKQFGNLLEDRQLAENYLPNEVWSTLKTLLLSMNSNIVTKDIDNEHKITVLVEQEEQNFYYYCTIHKEEQGPLFNALFEHNLDPIVMITPDSTILNTNNAARAKFGYKNANVTGNSLYDFIPFFSKNAIQKLIEDTVALHKPIELTNCGIKTIAGRTLTIVVRSIPIIEHQTISKILLLLRDVTSYSEETSYVSYHDQLTGAWNNKALSEHFLNDIKIAKQKNKKIAVMAIDLDRFKKINETYGSSIGDHILCEVVNRISKITNDCGHLYRQNGDNFIFVLQNATNERIQFFATQIMDIIKEPFIVEELEISISTSIGISTFPNDGGNIDELLRKSSQAQLYVKERGRSGYHFYQNNMEDQFQNTALMEAHLRRAIEKKELILYYQPQIDLETGKITSCEALLRWQNPKFGFVSPGQFIPIAEDSGLIIEIGNWVIEQACKQLREWKKLGISNIRIAVNISPKQFKEDTLASKIFQYLKEYDIDPKMLEIEITESSMTDEEDTMTILKQLKSMGLIISIDDFGTGYSSLSYIKRYPIDIIKIDQSFIRDMDNDEKDRAIAKTIVHLAHSLGLDVIAEGVEKEEHVRFLKEYQCKKAQGFLFSKPVSVEQLMKVVSLT